MNLQRRRAVSAIVATLLLIAITVSAAVLVYVFVGGAAGNLTKNGGQQVNEHLAIQSYTYEISPGSCGCTQQVIEIFLFNTGGGATVISAVYYDGALLTVTTPSTSPATALVNNAVYLLPSTTLMASSGAGELGFSSNAQLQSYPSQQVGQMVITFTSAAVFNSGHTIKVVSQDGATNVYTVIAGEAG